MQYGNLHIGGWRMARKYRFKSYYVVWKPRSVCNYMFIRNCLNRTMQYGNAIGTIDPIKYLEMFKSYYVVWKQKGILGMTLKKIGLNRTMQYGNEIDIRKSCRCRHSLNRTMQYGNIFPICVGTAPTLGLNRTMQYGNYFCSEKYI